MQVISASIHWRLHYYHAWMRCDTVKTFLELNMWRWGKGVVREGGGGYYGLWDNNAIVLRAIIEA